MYVVGRVVGMQGDAVLRCVVAIVFIRYDFSFLFSFLRTRSRELSCKGSGKLGDCKRKTLFCGLSPVNVRKHKAVPTAAGL